MRNVAQLTSKLAALFILCEGSMRIRVKRNQESRTGNLLSVPIVLSIKVSERIYSELEQVN